MPRPIATTMLLKMFEGPMTCIVVNTEQRLTILRLYRTWRTRRYKGGLGQERKRARSEALYEAEQCVDSWQVYLKYG